MAELVDDGRTGLHFNPGDPDDLAAKIRSILAAPLKLARMRQAARQTFVSRFTAGTSYQALMDIYVRAIAGAVGRESTGGAYRHIDIPT
jgi:glycosyltransferase involved in cell wall biosynthesis